MLLILMGADLLVAGETQPVKELAQIVLMKGESCNVNTHVDNVFVQKHSKGMLKPNRARYVDAQMKGV